jgi:hypothetical protein
MAKWCETCKQAYGDDQTSCPRCTAQVAAQDVLEAVEAELVPDKLPVRPGDSAIDLGTAGRMHTGAETDQAPLSESGQSVVEWAALVEDAPPTEGTAAVVDSPSDQDLIALAQAEETALRKRSGGRPETDHALASDLEWAQAWSAEQGTTEAGAAGLPVPPSTLARKQQTEEIVQAELVEESGDARRGESSGINLGDVGPGKPAGPVSDVELLSRPEMQFSDVNLLSGHDLGGSDVEVLSGQSPSSGDVEVISSHDFGSSDVDLLSKPGLFAEETDSEGAVQLPKQGTPSSEDSEGKVALADSLAVGKESSEVELGGKRTNVPRSGERAAPAGAGPYGKSPGSEVGQGSGIDFGPFPPTPGVPSNVRSPALDTGSNIDLGDLALSSPSMEPGGIETTDSSIDFASPPDPVSAPGSEELLGDEWPERAEPAEEPAPVPAGMSVEPALESRPEAPTKNQRSWVGWVGGAVIGAGVCVALWAFGIQPPSGLRLFGDEPKKTPITNPGSPSPNLANQALAQKLMADQIIDKPEDVEQGIDQLLSARKAAVEELGKQKAAAEEALKAATDAKTEAAGLRTQLAKATGGTGDAQAKLEAAQKKAEAALMEAANQKKAADSARAEAAGFKDKLEAANTRVAAAEKQLKDQQLREQRLNAEKGQAESLLQKVADDLMAAKFLDPRADKTAIAQALQEALKVAANVDSTGQVRALQTEIKRIQEQLKERSQAAGSGLTGQGSLATMIGNPLEAEKHYSAGLRRYFARDYEQAEKEFRAAVNNDSQDARYFYFLGLARWARGDREASRDFEQAVRLEQQNRPSREAVAAALERVQGPMRRVVNEIRSRSQ